MGSLGRDEAIDKHEQDAKGASRSAHVDAELGKRREKALERADTLRTVLGVRGAEGARPGMPLQRSPAFPREVAQRAAPVCEAGGGPLEIRVQGIEYQVEKIALAGDIVIQRHRTRAEFRGDSTNGDGRQAMPVRQPDACGNDAFQAQAISRFLPKQSVPCGGDCCSGLGPARGWL